ncbi:MAG: GGDEF domain-containing protein [Rhodobacteraceae bacterium]|nr:GGDEF domain-containing protein [Paracoccaceae bacterium]
MQRSRWLIRRAARAIPQLAGLCMVVSALAFANFLLGSFAVLGTATPPMTAFLAATLAVALVLGRRRTGAGSHAAQALAVLVIAATGTRVLGPAFGILQANSSVFPSALPTAIFALLGIALAARRRARFAMFAGLAAVTLWVSVFVGYSYGIAPAHNMDLLSLVLTGLLCLATGLRHLHPVPVALFLSMEASGIVLRRHLFFACTGIWITGLLLIKNATSIAPETMALMVTAILAAVSAAMASSLTLLSDAERARQRYVDSVELMSRTDMLTGLANRRAVQARAESALLEARQSRSPFSIILVDIDLFKRVNDQFGHYAGDGILRDAARLLGAGFQHCETAGLAARWGGEEFMLILPDTTLAEAATYAERLRLTFERELRLPAVKGQGRSRAGKVTASFGCTQISASETNIDAAFIRADQALYRAKSLGRNRVETSEIGAKQRGFSTQSDEAAA